MQIIPSDVWTIIDSINDMEDGIPPVGGGALDQTESFMQARRFVTDEMAKLKTPEK